MRVNKIKGYSKSTSKPSLDVNIERLLLPQRKRPLPINPVARARGQGEVELIDEPGKDEAHLGVSQTNSNVS